MSTLLQPMKNKFFINLARSVVFFSTLAIQFYNSPTVVAQTQYTCSGSVSCYEQIDNYKCVGGFDDGDSCSGSSGCTGGSCVNVGSEERVDGGSCPGGLYNLGSACGSGCHPGLRTEGRCSAVPVYYPPPPPPPPNPDPTDPTDPTATLYTCSGTSCVVSTTGSGWTDANCSGACNFVPPEDEPICTNCVEVGCSDDGGPLPNTHVMNDGFLKPGETLTWSTHKAGGGINSTRVDRIFSTASETNTYKPPGYSSYTCPGDAICLITRFRNAAYFTMGLELQLYDKQKYCVDVHDNFTEPCTKSNQCSTGETCGFKPKWIFFAGPQNSTYILSYDERQTFLNRTYPGSITSTNTDISAEKRIPFSAFMFYWLNCASLINLNPNSPPGFCPSRAAGNPTTGNYFSMERDLFQITSYPNYWCNGTDMWSCRKFSDGVLRPETENPLAHASWWREAIIQVPLEYMTNGTNTFNFKVAVRGHANSYEETKKCDKGTFTYLYSPEEQQDYVFAQARCDSLEINPMAPAETLMDDEGNEIKIPRIGIGDTVNISGYFAPTVQYYPIKNADFERVNQFGFPDHWYSLGDPTGVNAVVKTCTDASLCDPNMLQRKYLSLNPVSGSTNLSIATDFTEANTQPDGNTFGISFSIRSPNAFNPTDPPGVSNVKLVREPNSYRDASSWDITTQYDFSPIQFLYLTSQSQNYSLSNPAWNIARGIASFEPKVNLGPDSWRRDNALSSTKLRLVLPLLNNSLPTDYADVSISSNPIPTKLEHFIQRIPDQWVDSMKLAYASGDWSKTNQNYIDHFRSGTNWTSISPTWAYAVGGYRYGNWTVSDTFTSGHYLLVTNVHNGYVNDDFTQKKMCTGNPYADFSTWADCSGTCAKIIELVQCVSTVNQPVVSLQSDGSNSPLSLDSTTPTITDPNILNTNPITYSFPIKVRIPIVDYYPGTIIEALIYKRESSVTLPGQAEPIPESGVPNTQYVSSSTASINGEFYEFILPLTADVSMGTGLTIAVRTVNTVCEPIRSTWKRNYVNLQTSLPISVRVSQTTDGLCTTSSIQLPENQAVQLKYYQNVAASQGQPIKNFTSPSFFTTSGSYILPKESGPYFSPWTWSSNNAMSSLRLIPPTRPSDSELEYVCSSANPYTLDGCAHPSPLAAPRDLTKSGFNFCLIYGNVMHYSWWQARGGLIFAQGAVSSKLPLKQNEQPSDNCTGDLCQPFIAAKAMGNATRDSHSSAGFVISNASVTNSPSGVLGWLSQNLVGSAARATGTPIPSLQTPSYDSFIKKIDLGRVDTISMGPKFFDDIEAFINGSGKVYETKDGFTTRVALINGSSSLRFPVVTIDNDSQIQVPQNTRIVIFVEGDLTISDLASSQRSNLITVGANSSLIFIVRDNITFDISLGYSDITKTEPIITGIFFADKLLTVASNGGTQPGDKKFVGAGSFIGKTGVKLERKFDSSEILSREMNAKSPVDMFIHRPDLVLNTPEVLMESSTTWQEVN